MLRMRMQVCVCGRETHRCTSNSTALWFKFLYFILFTQRCGRNHNSNL